jgi:multisubunit Na+/H+ antiporter MnhC subunit
MANLVKRIDWLATVLYPLIVILMETFWMYPLLVWVGFWTLFTESRPVLSLASIIVVLVVSLTMTRLIAKRDWPLWVIQAVVIGAGLVTMFLVLRIDYNGGYGFTEGGWYGEIGRMLGATFNKPYPVLLAIIVLIYLWWRGIQLGRTVNFFSNIYRSFIVGMVFFILLILLWNLGSTAGTEGPIEDVGFYVIAFFFFGLVTLSVCHIYVMRRRMPTSDTATSVWRSLPIMLGVIGGIVVVGFAAASLMSPEFYNAVGNAFGVVGDALYKAFTWVMERLNFIFEGIFWVLQWFLNLIRNTERQEQEGAWEGGMFDNVENASVELPEAFTIAFKWTAIAIIIAVVIFILARAISRYRARRKPEDIEEIHESLWSAGTLREDLRQLLNMLGNRLKRKPKPAAVYFDDKAGRLNIREIYRRLLWEASQQGVVRRKHETPVEYEGRLGRYVPEGTEQLAEITDLYSEVRYGDIEPGEEKTENANGLWPMLRGMVRRITGG